MTTELNTELIFEVIQSKAGEFSASCLNAQIDTGGSTLQELHDNISSAIDEHFPVGAKPDPSEIHLMLFQE